MRIVGNNQGLWILAHCEKEQVLAGEGGPGGDRTALFHEKELQHSTAERRSDWQDVDMVCKVRVGAGFPQRYFKSTTKDS